MPPGARSDEWLCARVEAEQFKSKLKEVIRLKDQLKSIAERRSAPQVGSWSRLLLAGPSSLQLPWLRRWNLTGDIRRYHYLKLCLIRSSDLHVKLNIRLSDPQYPVSKYRFPNSVVAAIKNFNVCEFPAFRVNIDIGVKIDGPGQITLLFLQFYRLKDF